MRLSDLRQGLAALNDWSINPNTKPSRRDLLAAGTGALAGGGVVAAVLKPNREAELQIGNTTDNLIAVIEEQSKSNDPKDKIATVKSLLTVIPQIKTDKATLSQLTQVLANLDLATVVKDNDESAMLAGGAVTLDRVIIGDKILVTDSNLLSLINGKQYTTALALILNIAKQTDASVEERAQAVLALPSIIDLRKLQTEVPTKVRDINIHEQEAQRPTPVATTPNAQARRMEVLAQLGLPTSLNG